MMTTQQIRNERLADLSKMIIDGNIVQKLDHIATISINGRFYFNAYRRYNSPYNVVIEDANMDIYLHQDHTVRKSLQTVLCLPEYDASCIYTWNASSFKHNGPVPSLDMDIADMRWSDIHNKYYAINVNFAGIFYDIEYNSHQNAPSTPIAQMIPEEREVPAAPERPIKNEDESTANILISLCIPQVSNDFHMSESDGPTLSMRFADIMNRKASRHPPVCYCEMDDDDDDYDDDDYEDESNNYTILRSGTMIPKV